MPAHKSPGHHDPWTLLQAHLMSFLPYLLPAATWIWVLVPECIETLSQLEVFAYVVPSACNVLPCSLCCLLPFQPFKLRLIISLWGLLWVYSIFSLLECLLLLFFTICDYLFFSFIFSTRLSPDVIFFTRFIPVINPISGMSWSTITICWLNEWSFCHKKYRQKKNT